MNTLGVSERMAGIPPSGIRRVFEQARALEAQGKKIIHLEIGRPDFDTPAHIKEAAMAALREGKVHYTSNWGILPLREAISRSLEKELGVPYDPEGEIIITAGAAEGVLDTIMALVDPGDEVLVPDPGWVNYPAATAMAHGRPVSYSLRADNDFQIDLEELKSLLSPKTKLVVLVTPHNPTGGMLERRILAEIGHLAAEHGFFIMSDEIYHKMIYDGHQHVSIAALPGMKERTVIINGFSKAYAMTGWRVGYVAAPKALAAAINKVHQHNTTCAASFAQYGALAALTGPQDCVANMVREFDRRRLFLWEGINAIPGLSCPRPRGAFYAFVDVRGCGLSAEEFASRLLTEAGVAVVPGDVFGRAGAGFVRISYASSYEEIQGALERIKQFTQSLGGTT
ncbi:MAG: pyridoxal phosphate-dependent aminotransferase [Limnochordia bacterium]